MKKFLLLTTLVIISLSLKSQFVMHYEDSFRNWQPYQGWVIIDTDTIVQTVGIVNNSQTSGVPVPTTEIMDYMLGVKSLVGASNKIFMTPPISLQNNPWAQFYSNKSASASFSLWVVANPNDTTISGLTDSVSVLNNNGFNNFNLTPYANTAIRLAFKIKGNNPTAYIDDFKVFDKVSQAYVPDSCFRTYLKSIIPTAFIGDSLDYTSNAVSSVKNIVSANGCIKSMEGLQYFVFLDKIEVPNNQISYFPSNRLPYLTRLVVNNNYIISIPNIPIATYINYDNNLVRNIPDYSNKSCTYFHADNNLIYDCFKCTNRFVNGSLLNNVSVYQAGCMYYTLVYSFDSSLPLPNCSQSIGFIGGTVYYDKNQNGVHDVSDINMKNQHVNFFQSTDMITNKDGYYGFSVDSGIVSVTVNQLPSYLQCTNPFNGVIGPDENIQHDFRIIATSQFDDIEAKLLNNGSVMVNESLILMINLKNNGTTTNTAIAKLPLPAGTTYSSSTFGNVTGDTLYWTTSLEPFESKSNSVVLSVSGLTPNQNQVFNVVAETTLDVNLTNNNSSTTVFIADSVLVNPLWGFPHDPNNKLVSTPVVKPGFNDYLYYNINFENIGTANATHVTVSDKLSSMLNAASFEFIGSTHPCATSYAQDNTIQFSFYPIALTPASVDSINSKGSLWFRIKPISPMQFGDSIFNNAKIIFDTQAPITTELAKVGVIDTSLTVSDFTITANAADIEYQWIDCNNSYLSIAGATQQGYTPAVNGDFAVLVTQGLCTDTSACMKIYKLGLSSNQNESARISIYPNPVSDELTIEIKKNKEKVNFEILNAIGQVVLKGYLQEKTVVSTTNFTPGVYLIKLGNDKVFEIKKFMKK